MQRRGESTRPLLVGKRIATRGISVCALTSCRSNPAVSHLTRRPLSGKREQLRACGRLRCLRECCCVWSQHIRECQCWRCGELCWGGKRFTCTDGDALKPAPKVGRVDPVRRFAPREQLVGLHYGEAAHGVKGYAEREQRICNGAIACTRIRRVISRAKERDLATGLCDGTKCADQCRECAGGGPLNLQQC